MIFTIFINTQYIKISNMFFLTIKAINIFNYLIHYYYLFTSKNEILIYKKKN